MNVSPKIFKRVFVFLQIITISLLLNAMVRAAGEVDPSFNAAVQETTAGTVQTIVVQPDGKILVGGSFTVADNAARTDIARFNADGTIDSTFDPPDFAALRDFAYSITASVINAVAVQADGKILVGGSFLYVNRQPKVGIVRLNADGSLDQTFAPTLATQAPDVSVRDIKVQADGKILVAGYHIDIIGDRPGLIRFNPDGSVDGTFQELVQSINSFVIQPDGKIVVATSDGTGAYRLNANGAVDGSFSPVTIGAVNKVVMQADGKILIGGSFSSVNGVPQNNIARVNADGNLDAAFNTNGAGANAAVNAIAVLPDGKIVIGGSFTSYNGTARTKNSRLNSDGSLDTTFNFNPGGTSAVINAAAASSDGKIYLGGGDTSGVFDRKFVRLNTDGTTDAGFVGAIYQKGLVYRVLAQLDGKVLVVGTFKKVNGVARQNVARLNADGTLDTGFVANASGTVYTVALQSDGKIIVAGSFSQINAGGNHADITRLNADGSVDTTFQPPVSRPVNTFAPINAVIVQADGKILIGGIFNLSGVQANVARLNADGTPDASFTKAVITQPTNSQTVYAMKLQADGKIVIGGSFTQINNLNRGNFARLNTDGTLDSTFNPPFGANGAVYDLAIQSNGSVVISGIFSGVNGTNNLYYLARVSSTGALDATFAPQPNAPVYAVEKQTDDKILIGGQFTAVGGTTRYNLARLNTNGTLDNTFNNSGANEIVRNIYAQPNGNILVGGEFSRISGISRVGVARLLTAPAARALYDFDGDGKAEVSVFRPSSGYWYELRSQNSGFYALQFGASSDLIAPADYDGDGKTDIAVWRGVVPGAGNFAYFYIYRSSDNVFVPVQFGATGDVPISGDFDGDGKADLAVYRDGSQTGGQSYFFYRPTSAPAENYRTIVWGGTGDKPLYGDFDGDGKLDAAIFRPSSGQWFILRSSDNQVVNVAFGVSGDIPVPADYDGDGRANIAVFRPSNGTWYTSQNPATNYGAVLFGQTGDLPVPADYDGDGKADVAVFRPSSGAWYQLRSTQGFTGVAFGDANDKPIPNAYIR